MAATRRPRAAGELTPKGEQTRQRIVIAAAQVMFDRSVAETTIEDVRAAAGVSSSQVYHYFTDKKALVQAVIEYQDQTIVGGQEPMLVSLDSLEGLSAWRDFLIAHQEQLGCRGGCPIGSLGSELAETDNDARVRVAASFRRWEGAIRSGLRGMQARGELGSADPDALALATLAALQGGLLLTQMQRSTTPLATALDAMLMLIAHEAARPTEAPHPGVGCPRALSARPAVSARQVTVNRPRR
jgi:TetR/AcrR family transcriptional regulator, transcriptional repressor for nem operon